MWKRWGEPAIRWFATSHMGFIAHLPEVLRVRREFIDQRVAAIAGAGDAAAYRSHASGRFPVWAGRRLTQRRRSVDAQRGGIAPSEFVMRNAVEMFDYI